MSDFYFYDLSDVAVDIEDLKKNLPDTVIQHCERYKNEQDLRNSFFAWAKIFKDKMIPKDVQVSFNDFGKPSIPSLEFNLSHSKDVVAIVYSNHACGIDVQLVDTKKDIELLSERVLTPKEKQVFDASEDKPLCFTKYWTNKEAYYKRLGQGIDVHQLNREINDPSWVQREIVASDSSRYVLTVSASEIRIPKQLF